MNTEQLNTIEIIGTDNGDIVAIIENGHVVYSAKAKL